MIWRLPLLIFAFSCSRGRPHVFTHLKLHYSTHRHSLGIVTWVNEWVRACVHVCSNLWVLLFIRIVPFFFVLWDKNSLSGSKPYKTIILIFNGRFCVSLLMVIFSSVSSWFKKEEDFFFSSRGVALSKSYYYDWQITTSPSHSISSPRNGVYLFSTKWSLSLLHEMESISSPRNGVYLFSTKWSLSLLHEMENCM